jgi:Pectate lyase superfamily protein
MGSLIPSSHEDDAGQHSADALGLNRRRLVAGAGAALGTVGLLGMGAAPAGAQTDPYALKANLPLNAKDYATIQDAINALPSGGGAVYIPRGTYNLSSPLTLPKPTLLFGDGAGTVLRATGNNFCVKPIASDCWIDSITFEAASQQTAGGAIDYSSLNGTRQRVEHCLFRDNLFYGLNVAPPTNPGNFYFRNLVWDSVLGNGVTGCNTALRIAATQHLVGFYCENLTGQAITRSGMEVWLSISNNVDTFHLMNSLFVRGHYGIIVGEDLAAADVTGAKFDNVVVDDMNNAGLLIRKCLDVQWTACAVQGCGWETNPGQPGMVIGYPGAVNGQARGVRVNGGIVQTCAGDGIALNATSNNVDITGTLVCNNNALATPLYKSGIVVAAGASDFRINGVTSRNDLPAGGNQRNGILVAAGASNRYQIVNCLCPTDSRQTVGISDGGTGAAKVKANNITSAA